MSNESRIRVGDEARQLVRELAGVEARCPLNPRDHRRYVREFIRLIHKITGKTYSPAIYRRLLSAYASARKPSTATLALERERFVKELELAPPAFAAGPEPDLAGHGGNLIAEIRQALVDMAGHRMPAAARMLTITFRRNATSCSSGCRTARNSLLKRRIANTRSTRSAKS